LLADAGITPAEARTMIAVANVPKAQFEAMVEGDRPATLKQLVAAGRLSSTWLSEYATAPSSAAARYSITSKLIEGGMTHRQAAKALRVGKARSDGTWRILRQPRLSAAHSARSSWRLSRRGCRPRRAAISGRQG
jgi:hypothetical protein